MYLIEAPHRAPEARPEPRASVWQELERWIRSEDSATALDALHHELRRQRKVLDDHAWRALVTSPVLEPVRRVLLEDPLTARARARPRGYPGDAVTLDYIYGIRPAPDSTTALGARIFAYTTRAACSRAVRERRELLAATLDDVAQSHSAANVLALACGHLREAQLSVAVRSRRLGRFDALDQDPRSLAVVEREQSTLGVTPICASIQTLVSGALQLGSYHLVYAGGLYDYLPRAAAVALMRAVFRMLEPGGRLLIGNFARGAVDAAGLEATLDWWLIYRDEEELGELATVLPRRELGRVRTFRDSLRQVVYLEIERA